jgi:hypothetical protein
VKKIKIKQTTTHLQETRNKRKMTTTTTTSLAVPLSDITVAGLLTLIEDINYQLSLENDYKKQVSLQYTSKSWSDGPVLFNIAWSLLVSIDSIPVCGVIIYIPSPSYTLQIAEEFHRSIVTTISSSMYYCCHPLMESNNFQVMIIANHVDLVYEMKQLLDSLLILQRSGYGCLTSKRKKTVLDNNNNNNMDCNSTNTSLFGPSTITCESFSSNDGIIICNNSNNVLPPGVLPKWTCIISR